jgi:hypothetical protein
MRQRFMVDETARGCPARQDEAKAGRRMQCFNDVETASFFLDFCLTGGVIYRNQHGLTQIRNRQSGEVGGNERRKQPC